MTAYLIQFLLSFSVVLFFVTFVLKIPHQITNQPSLVNDYYFKHFNTSVPLDFLLVFLYLQAAEYIIHVTNVKTIAKQSFIVAGITALLTTGFCYYFRAMPLSSTFFSKWFHSAGYLSVLYDVILLVTTYIVMKYLQNIV